MHWFWNYPWGPALTWVVVFAVLTVLAVSFYTIRKELKSAWAMSVIALRVLALVMVLFVLLQPQVKTVSSTVLTSSIGVLIDTSKSMGVKDAGSVKTRFEIAKEILGTAEEGLLAELQRRGNLRIFEFSTNTTELSFEGLADLVEPLGDSTRIGSAIETALEMFGQEDLTNLIVLTDGGDNAGRPPLEVAGSDRVPPLLMIGIGEKAEVGTDEFRDYAVENVVRDQRVVVGRATEVQASVSMRGYPNRHVPVELLHRDRVIASTVVSLTNERPKAEAILTYTPDTPGQYEYTVRIAIEPDEIDTQNNERNFTVTVVDPVNRVLYAEDAPRFEFTPLNRVLRRNRNLDLTSLVQMAEGLLIVQGDQNATTPRQALSEYALDRYKVVIIGDVGHQYFAGDELERLARFVEHGGSLILLGGKRSFGPQGFANTPLAAVLPVIPTAEDRYIEVETEVAAGAAGAAHPVLQKLTIDWRVAPTLLSVITTGQLRAGATVLLATAQERRPVVVVHNYGQGKAAVVLTDSTWRWRLGQATEPLPIDLYQVFWTSLVEWMLPEELEHRRARAVELITDKDDYELNEQVHLIVTVTDDDGLVDDAAVSCEVTAPDGRTLVYQGRYGDISAYSAALRDGYRTFFTPHASGRYNVVAIAERGGMEIGRERVSFVVGDPMLEFRNTDINDELMKRLAARTGGRYYTPQTVNQLKDDVVFRERTVQKTEQREVWNDWWVLVSFLALMTSEWIVRKKRQLA